MQCPVWGLALQRASCKVTGNIPAPERGHNCVSRADDTSNQSGQSLSRIRLFATPWTAAHQASQLPELAQTHVHQAGDAIQPSCLFAFTNCSWGSQGKNAEVVCHSLLQWTTFCQSSPPWPVRLGWPYTAWLMVPLSQESEICYCIKKKKKKRSLLGWYLMPLSALCLF